MDSFLPVQVSWTPQTAASGSDFYPYTNNAGTVAGISGGDFCVMAADTRQSFGVGYLINTRYQPKMFKLSNGSVLGTSGFYADGLTLIKRINQRLEWYKHAHDKEMSTPALAQLLSITLYSKRFFPYYARVLLGGLDLEGHGVVYGYDSIGSYEPCLARATGSGGSLIQPFLDNQIYRKTPLGILQAPHTLDQVKAVMRDSFTSATERDIQTGDYLELFIITAQGVDVEKYDLRKD
ncbi:3486_t:CDS:2 [Paraglomus brasilianum]|uniref:3486_t:CDS:1 n=1 Tax=Paraglomus brasilianum TaxID=144538 RepID=A0A9N9FHM0_9GLOM|nr:3486_t:CDS:2 [Paraglomus brasilianum]